MTGLITLQPWRNPPSSPIAEQLAAISLPRSPHFHTQLLGERAVLFVVNGSQVYDVERTVAEQLEEAVGFGDVRVLQLLRELGLEMPVQIGDSVPHEPPVRALSLAVAQKCNLGCTYCYADQGAFGGSEQNMMADTARAAVDLLLAGACSEQRFSLSFLGGEPLVNRPVIQEVTAYATARAAEKRARMTFAITTNGTLVTEEDADFFESYGFAVTVSLDGLREEHDRQRPFKNGGGSFDRILDRVKPLLARQHRMQVSARASITPGQVRLKEMLDYFLELKFHSVGFSPVIRSPNGNGEHTAADLMPFLEAMVECGLEFERRLLCGQRYAFSNIVNALREIHKGTHRPYPCGAGAGYFGISAAGEIAACHRFVGDKDGCLGDLTSGIDRHRQARWLAERHIHTQSPCTGCWARYLCGGGCHHEVLARGRQACDYIRGWLAYCLQAYHRLLPLRPDWFGPEE